MIIEYQKKLLSFSESELLARLIWGEARNQSLRGKVAVACVVMNRYETRRYGTTIPGVITRKWQFSCFNGLWSDDLSDDDPNLAKMLNDPGEPITACRVIAEMAIDGLINDPTGGATHYHTLKSDPTWNDDPSMMIYLKTIGDHKFYREI